MNSANYMRFEFFATLTRYNIFVLAILKVKYITNLIEEMDTRLFCKVGSCWSTDIHLYVSGKKPTDFYVALIYIKTLLKFIIQLSNKMFLNAGEYWRAIHGSLLNANFSWNNRIRTETFYRHKLTLLHFKCKQGWKTSYRLVSSGSRFWNLIY